MKKMKEALSNFVFGFWMSLWLVMVFFISLASCSIVLLVGAYNKIAKKKE